MQRVACLRGQKRRGANGAIGVGNAPSVLKERLVSPGIANQATQDGRIGPREAPKGLGPLGG